MFTNYLIGVFVFLLGLCIGSFLNCVVYRLEEKKSLSGRSFCPNCKHTLSWKDLVPVFSYLYLGGKCRYCRKKISIQYPIVEVATGIIFLLVFWKFIVIPNSIGNPELKTWIPAFAGMTVYLSLLFYISAVLMIIFIYDLKHYIIPDKILFPAIAITFIYRIIGFKSFLDFLAAAVIASGFFLALFLISKGKWMGFGDVKLAILMGLLLGWQNVLAALFLSFFFGSVIGVGLMILHKKGLKSEIPFAPFLITGTFIALFFGQQIVQSYLKFIF